MAKLNGLIQLHGSIGGITGRRTKNGIVLQEKSGPTREQVLEHESFDVTRRNAGEFKGAIKDATLLRRSMGSIINAVKSSTLNGYTNGLMHRIAMSDTISSYGKRCAANGDLQQLQGFDLNQELSVDKVFRVKLAHCMDVAAGSMRLEVPTFIARRKKSIFPPDATHFKLISCAAVVDFKGNYYNWRLTMSELLPLSRKTPGAICLENRLQAKPGQVLLHVIGVAFYAIVKGEEELLRGGALKIVEVKKMEAQEVKEWQAMPGLQADCLPQGLPVEQVHAHTDTTVVRDCIPDEVLTLFTRFNRFQPVLLHDGEDTLHVGRAACIDHFSYFPKIGWSDRGGREHAKRFGRDIVHIGKAMHCTTLDKTFVTSF
jgi:hypothetical protein